jgi:hypothetical protein
MPIPNGSLSAPVLDACHTIAVAIVTHPDKPRLPELLAELIKLEVIELRALMATPPTGRAS